MWIVAIIELSLVYEMAYMNPANFGMLDPKKWRDYPDHYTSSIWPSDLPHSPKDYGNNEFHGRTHPEIIFTTLQRYNSPGETVWDPMAGSGTTIDVCKELEMNCIATDINPSRLDVVKRDATIWTPKDQVDAIILHPPYMAVIDYGNESNNLSTSYVSEYIALMGCVVQNVINSLNLDRVCTLIIGNVYQNSQVYALDSELHGLFRKNFRLLGKVVRPFGETKGGSQSGKKNENLWKYRRLKYGIWELGIDYVMFYQLIRK